MPKIGNARRAAPAIAGLAIALALVASACGKDAPEPGTNPGARASFPVTITDDDGVSVTVKRPPRRIVTFAPSNTEIVFALGLGRRLVGVSGPYDDYPKAARAVPEVGGAGEFGVDPNLEKVVSLDPDLMLTISGGEEWKEKLRELGIPIFTVNAMDFRDLLGDIRKVGVLTGALEQARRLTAGMQAEARELASVVSKEPPVSCFFEVYYPPLTTVGPKSFIFDLLERSGCDPVSAGAKSDYPNWSVEQLVSEGTEVYLVSSESGVSPKAVARRPGFDAIPAVRRGDVHLVQSDLVARPGPRVVEGLRRLGRLLHPSVFS